MEYNKEYEKFLNTLSTLDREKVIYLSNFYTKEKIVNQKDFVYDAIEKIDLDKLYKFKEPIDEKTRRLFDKLNFEDIKDFLKINKKDLYANLKKSGVKPPIFIYLLSKTEIPEERKCRYINSMGDFYKKNAKFEVITPEKIENVIIESVEIESKKENFDFRNINNFIKNKMQEKIVEEKESKGSRVFIEFDLKKNDDVNEKYENFIDIYSNSINAFDIEEIFMIYIEKNIDNLDLSKLDYVLSDKAFFENTPFFNDIVLDNFVKCLKTGEKFEIEEMKSILENQIKNIDVSYIDKEENEKTLNLINIYIKTGNVRSSILSEVGIANIDKEILDKVLELNNGILSNEDIVLKSVFKEKYENFNENEKHILSKHLEGFEVGNLKEVDFDFLYNNSEEILHLDIHQLYYLKNIKSNEKIVKLLKNLPYQIREEIEEINLGIKAEEVEAIIMALSRGLENDIKEEETYPNVLRNITDLPKDKQKKFKEFANQEEIRIYKENLGLPEDFTFGIEFEVKGISVKALNKITESEMITDYINLRQGTEADFSNWKIKKDDTVPGGAEIASPILSDTKEDWDSIKEISLFLKSLGAYADEDCGGHVHIGADILENNSKAYENLFEMFSNCESIIYKMSNSPGDKLRKDSYKHAAPVKSIIDEILKKGSIKIRNEDDLNELAYKYSNCYIENLTQISKGKIINLENISIGGLNTIEFRQSNEIKDLDYIEKQKNIFLDAKIIHTSILNAKNPNYKKKIKEKLKDEDLDENEKSLYLLDYLFDSTFDKVVFYERYLAHEKELKIGDIEYDKYIEGKVIGIDNKRKEQDNWMR